MIFSSNCFSPENWESNKFDICLRHSVLDGTGDMQGWAIWTQSRCLVGVKGQALHYIVIAHFWSPLFSWRAGMKHFFCIFMHLPATNFISILLTTFWLKKEVSFLLPSIIIYLIFYGGAQRIGKREICKALHQSLSANVTFDTSELKAAA